MTSLMLVSRNTQGSHGHGKSWKTMENEKIKSRPGKVMENENLAKSHGILIFHKYLSRFFWHTITRTVKY